MRDVIFYIHLLASIVFVTLLLLLLVISLLKTLKKRGYTIFDIKHARWTLLFLYLQSALGVYLYFSNPENLIEGAATAEELSHNVFFRFWQIEHFIMMFFTLVIAQLGTILAAQSQVEKQHKIRFFYFFTVFIMVSISLIFSHYK